MNLQQYLLNKLSEEASEVIQITQKTQQYGFHERCPGQTRTNAERMHLEIDDFMAQISMLNDVGLNYEPNPVNVKAKKEKVIRGLRLAVQLGNVDSEALEQYKNMADCEHEWVSAVNKKCLSGEICIKCRAIRA